MSSSTALNAFLQDADCLEPIAKIINKVNIFKVLGVSRTEIRHSNMLAWLLDPNGNHGLENRVLRGVIRLVDDRPLDYSGFSIRRETNHIDLLAVSKVEKYLLCIENKTYSGEHDNQLERYRQYLETAFPGYRMKLVYLTRKGTPSSDPEHWLPMGYGDIVKVIEEAMKDVILQPEADLIIDNYLEIVRDLYGGDDTLRKLCEKVYRKHQTALDLVFSNMDASMEEEDQPEGKTEERKRCEEIYRAHQAELDRIRRYRPGKGPDPIAEIMLQWANMKTDEGLIEVCPEKSNDLFIRFKTPIMSELLPDVPGMKFGWRTENVYFYELRNRKLKGHDEHELFLALCINAENITDDLRKMSDWINAASDLKSKNENWHHRINFATDHVIFEENADSEAVMAQLDSFLQELVDYEEKLAERLGLAERI